MSRTLGRFAPFPGPRRTRGQGELPKPLITQPLARFPYSKATVYYLSVWGEAAKLSAWRRLECARAMKVVNPFPHIPTATELSRSQLTFEPTDPSHGKTFATRRHKNGQCQKPIQTIHPAPSPVNPQGSSCVRAILQRRRRNRA